MTSTFLHGGQSCSVSMTMDSYLEFNLDHKGVNQGDSPCQVPYYMIRNKQLPEQGPNTNESLYFISETLAYITVMQPIAHGVYSDSTNSLSPVAAVDLVDGATVYSFESAGSGWPTCVSPADLLWRYDAVANEFFCAEAVVDEEYTLYLVTRVAAFGGVIPMSRRIVDNATSQSMDMTVVFCESEAMTQFYFGAETAPMTFTPPIGGKLE